MKVAELKQKVAELYKDLYWEYDLIGIRFEDKVRTEGEEVENCSRNNRWDEDNREFPKYGTPEYNEYEVMDGISTWNLVGGQKFNENINGWLWSNLDADVETEFIGTHAYIIVGDKAGYEQVNGLVDDGELLIADGKVAAVLY